MRMMDVDKLNPHPKNSYFFDDIEGEPWVAFLESIETSGVIEPIIVSAPDLTIVSGHQRVRACKKLGIKQVAVEERTFDSEDEILKQLIETNIRQRGVGNTNAVKFGRCVAELERIYGIRNGNNQHTQGGANGTSLKTQDDLAEEIGVSKDVLKRAKKLAELPEELQQMVMDGKVTASTASRVIARLPKEEQKQLAEQISGKDKVSNKEVEAEIARLKDENKRLKDDNKILARRAEPTVIEKTVEVVPDDYEELKRNAETARKDFKDMRKRYEEMSEKWKASEKEKRDIQQAWENEKSDPVKQTRESALLFCAGISNFIEKYGGYIWVTEKLDNLTPEEKKGFLSGIDALEMWVRQMRMNIEGIYEEH